VHGFLLVLKAIYHLDDLRGWGSNAIISRAISSIASSLVEAERLSELPSDSEGADDGSVGLPDGAAADPGASPVATPTLSSPPLVGLPLVWDFEVFEDALPESLPVLSGEHEERSTWKRMVNSASL
jgi:hypothetical protein